MGQIFQSFITGNQAGREDSEQRRRRNALDQAGTAYGSGDTEGAENALMAAGLVNEAGAYSALAEARRNRTNRTAITGAMTLDPNATPQQRAEAGANAALSAGDTDQWFQFRQASAAMSAQERAEAAERTETAARLALTVLPSVPFEQRAERAVQEAVNAGHSEEEARRQVANLDLSDEGLQALGQASLTAADIHAGRERQQRYAVQDRQFNQQLSLSRENAAYARNPDAAPVSDAQRRGLSNDYNRAIQGSMDNLGILRPSLPYARLAVTNGGDTSGIDGVNVRSSDVALLRAAARAQTGPGVLTESEVFSTLSPSLQQDLIRNTAYLDISREGITPQDRLALSQFVMQSARNVQRDAWDLYDQASTDWGSRTNAPTFQAPRIPHPEDEARLQLAERGGAQVGREYVANNGRTYRFLAPGSWELSRLGGEADRSLSWQPRAVEQQQSQPAPQQSRASGPPAGTVVNGYRFRGGDPNNQSNWERMQPGGYQGR